MSLNVPSFGVIALGIATAGMELARRAVIDRGALGRRRGAGRFAEMEVLLESARAVLYRHAHEMTAFDRAAQLPVIDLDRAATSRSTSPARTRSRSWTA